MKKVVSPNHAFSENNSMSKNEKLVGESLKDKNAFPYW